MEWSRSIADEGGVRRFEVLIPRPRRPGLISEVESRCARIGVGCELGTRGQGSRTGRLLILTVPAEADHHGFAELSRWIYVQLGTRPFDPAEAAAARERERQAAQAASRAWTTRELEFVVGLLVRREFLRGVEEICTASGARCEVQTRRERLIRTTVVTVSGPGAVVERTEAELLDWRRQFPSGG